MYVCICNAVTERQIQALAEQGIKSVEELGHINACSTTCGTCYEHADKVLRAAHQKLKAQSLFPVYLGNTAEA